jgi:hypothetical protein
MVSIVGFDSTIVNEGMYFFLLGDIWGRRGGIKNNI